jgi:hypothetical protein
VLQKAVSLIAKDVSWLWRMAYNLAVQGCSDWEEQYIAHTMELFDIAREASTLLFSKVRVLIFLQLLEACCKTSPVDDGELRVYLINASYSTICGQGMSKNKLITHDMSLFLILF